MERPQHPCCPDAHDYHKKEADEIILFNKTFVVEDINLADNYYDEFYNEETDELKPEINVESMVYENYVLSVHELLEKIPKDIDKRDVVVRMNRPRMMDYVRVDVVYRKPLDKKKLKKEFDLAMKEYYEETKVYVEEMKKFNEYEKQEKIKYYQKQIEKLRNKQTL